MEYVIEDSKDNGATWGEQARFKPGQRSRFNDRPFDEHVAVLEAKNYKGHFQHYNWLRVRVVIEV